MNELADELVNALIAEAVAVDKMIRNVPTVEEYQMPGWYTSVIAAHTAVKSSLLEMGEEDGEIGELVRQLFQS